MQMWREGGREGGREGRREGLRERLDPEGGDGLFVVPRAEGKDDFQR
jgi:hypothetical protein